MSGVDVVLQRDCLGGERVVELRLPRPVREEDFSRLVGVASQQILRGIPRPFFRVDVPGMYLLSGILSEAKIRFTVRLAQRDNAVAVALEAAGRMLGDGV